MGEELRRHPLLCRLSYSKELERDAILLQQILIPEFRESVRQIGLHMIEVWDRALGTYKDGNDE